MIFLCSVDDLLAPNILPVLCVETARPEPFQYRQRVQPFRHRDPSDRLLVAQALEDDLTIVSADGVFKKYGVAVIW